MYWCVMIPFNKALFQNLVSLKRIILVLLSYCDINGLTYNIEYLVVQRHLQACCSLRPLLYLFYLPSPTISAIKINQIKL